ncbi:HTH-type transcriptional regulator DmlR [compost metagenome]|jgi:DNA-binding transcriptional LysR family regulator|uniref:HTH-type transcriptional regulator PgrR n=1 Tax=Pseudomonas fluorescens TaxID=294 RepID=A0A5E7RMZ1_PSEFL|nr:LysR family transcriptional regulator [Pseudomonas fluorescens]VVP75030.1 HTH-type transcriptional regulator PgrR [Pseudomonas fluorescens]
MATPDLNNLVALLTVARERSFTRAAAQLGVSQSSLSRTVTALETKLGMLLLIRTTRSVSTTDAGQRLLDSVAPKLEEIEAELLAVTELREKPVGTVRISATDYAANQYIWPKLQSLLSEHEELHIELINDYGLSNIVAERFDIGVRLGDQVEKDMIAVRIAPDETLAIVGSPAYLKKRLAPEEPGDLTAHNCINLRLPTKDMLMPWELQKDGQRLDVKVSGQLVFNNAYQMLDAAIKGFGLAYLPKALAEPEVRAGRLRWVLEDWFPTFTGHHAYYATRRQSSMAVRLVIAALRSK